MLILQNLCNTITSIQSRVKPYGHKKIGRIMIFFWFVHLAATAALTILLIRDQANNALIGTFMIILQLMVTKIFESANKMYENCMRIQSNVSDINITILHAIKQYHAWMKKNNTNMYDDVSDMFDALNEHILQDLETYSKNMHVWSILVNSFLWKSPEFTPYLEKDAIKDRISAIMSQLQKEDERNLYQGSPTVTLDYAAY
ncbi:MAG: hypothetical protein EBT68_07140 [Verrucomicrobia bacterium]|nr:hypothetical protein [Verrucomicrobiota bacterium]